jgi:hypothetical protein
VPIRVTVGARYRLPNIDFESRTLEVEFTNAEWGIPEPQSREEAVEVLGRLTYLGHQHLLKSMVAARRHTVEEARGILARLARAHGLVEIPPEEAGAYLPPTRAVREAVPEPGGPAQPGGPEAAAGESAARVRAG